MVLSLNNEENKCYQIEDMEIKCIKSMMGFNKMDRISNKQIRKYLNIFSRKGKNSLRQTKIG